MRKSFVPNMPVDQKIEYAGVRIAIVASCFNSTIVECLLRGALETLSQYGVDANDIETFRVPGAFEIPALAQTVGASGRFDALICLGAIIQGETPHFHYLSQTVLQNIGQVALTLGLPVTCGILTVLSIEQAEARSGKEGNKGVEAAMAALSMIHTYRALQPTKSLQSMPTG